MLSNRNANKLARHRRPSNSRSRIGAAAVEFAVVAPVMILLTMGMIEVGRMVMVKQMMVNASREGARYASLPGTTNGDVVSRVQQELQDYAISGVQIVVTPADLSSAVAGTQVKVALSVQASQISWVPSPLFSLSKTISTSTTMRRESE